MKISFQQIFTMVISCGEIVINLETNRISVRLRDFYSQARETDLIFVKSM